MIEMSSIAPAIFALGASAALALLILNDQSRKAAFREEWKSKSGKLASLGKLPATGQVVPFRLIKENPVLPIQLDGDDHPTCWIVDSGYGYTAVSDKLFHRLGLPNTGTLPVQTLQTDDLISTTLPSGVILDLDPRTPDEGPVVEIPAHSAVVRPLSGTLEGTHGFGRDCPWASGEGGILGITFLRHFVTRLDYKNRTITFYDPARFPPPGLFPTSDKSSVQKFTGWLEAEHYFLIPMTIDGVEANMALDTGAFATIMTQGFLHKYRRAKGHDMEENRGHVQVSFSEHNTTLHKRQVGRAELGNHLMRNLVVLFPECGDSECPGLLSTGRFDGLLGYSVLKNFIIYMVYEPTPYVIMQVANDA
jgi:hypothetical protein